MLEENKTELTMKLFKGIYGVMIDSEFQDLSDDEIIKISRQTVAHFAKDKISKEISCLENIINSRLVLKTQFFGSNKHWQEYKDETAKIRNKHEDVVNKLNNIKN